MDEIYDLENKIKNELTEKDIKKYIELTMELKRKYLNDQEKYTILSHIQEYLKYKIDINNHKNLNIISLINTLFLPLGIIVGFFGMNFKSMGSPTNDHGIFTHDPLNIILICSFISILFSYILYKN